MSRFYTNNFSKFLLLGVLVLGLGAAGCSKKKNVKPDESTPVAAPAEEGSPSSDQGNAMGLETIHFPFDSFEVIGENKDILKKDVDIMKSNPGLKVQIEGHCDERGGIQYNLALGEKRAKAIKSLMVVAGIAKKRITTISMGKERPIAQGSGEDVWAKNRRGNFVITGK